MTAVVLASASPRRKDLLARVVWPYEILPADLDESERPGETPHEHVERLAREKALAVARLRPGAWVLGSDTVVVLGQRILGKPGNPEIAAGMLASLQDQTHQVLTGVAWVRDGEVRSSGVEISRVRFRPMTERQILSYAASPEPHDKAGAYALQGEGSAFVAGVEGDITNVIGLPIGLTTRLAEEAGVERPDIELPPEAVLARFRATQGELAGLAVGHGRRPADVKLVAVTKGQTDARVAALLAAGATDFGENYVREAQARQSRVDPDRRVRWHLIGPLQTNKAARASAAFDLVHTIDREAVARALVRAAEHPVQALVQVNVSADSAKAGVAPEALPDLLRRLQTVPGLAIQGLMTIGKAEASTDEARASFAALRQLRDQSVAATGLALPELSMGMSGDYAAAVAEGATLVRIGTAILGPRQGARAEDA